eukprot:CAMPEP_0168437104 /NCGR_PEP_ID=MMETSP0228-20121227/41263_1 /TAXON_ID=133427 /ORGANISM="Protoceratium reticulatum, Strain CCCM 535 (=CCMP 1889)" /LENGTH=266 /DNA_ID=CAMNT_0008451309 /DNA_START=17 /DNA_END=814 /DNA_ORIENTATION=+
MRGTRAMAPEARGLAPRTPLAGPKVVYSRDEPANAADTSRRAAQALVRKIEALDEENRRLEDEISSLRRRRVSGRGPDRSTGTGTGPGSAVGNEAAGSTADRYAVAGPASVPTPGIGLAGGPLGPTASVHGAAGIAVRRSFSPPQVAPTTTLTLGRSASAASTASGCMPHFAAVQGLPMRPLTARPVAVVPALGLSPRGCSASSCSGIALSPSVPRLDSPSWRKRSTAHFGKDDTLQVLVGLTTPAVDLPEARSVAERQDALPRER